MITKRGAFLLNYSAGEFIRPVKGGSNDQDFFGWQPGGKPFPTARDPAVSGNGCDGGKAHQKV